MRGKYRNIARVLHDVFILFLVITSLPDPLWSQENKILVNTDWDHERHAWSASWITHPECLRTEYGVYNLRNRFSLEVVPDTQFVYVSADNRYRLLVNGTEVAMGPARGSLMYWRYETIDIAPYLVEGENLIAAEVYNFGLLRPDAQFSYQTAFILQAEGAPQLNTPGSWVIQQNHAYTPVKVTREVVKGYYVAGPTDRIEGSEYPWGWEEIEFDDSGWATPVVITKGVGRGYMHGVPWMLVPRNIPMLEQRPEPISVIRFAEGIHPHPGFTSGDHPLTIPPETSCKILLDQEFLTTTFPMINLSGGEGARLKITYAETLYQEDLRKGDRNQVEGKKMIGYYDLILPEGGANRPYRTLSTRTYRYIQLEIATGSDPLTIHELKGIFTAYPFERNAHVSTGDSFHDHLQNIGWRTARLCAAETYMDCPYYEQLQYLGDTRIQSLISLYVSGDDRLMRNALLQADQSRLSDGLTLSRAPSAIPQIIPPFSLYWVDMVHDYYMHRRDDLFVESFLPGIESVLGWFQRRMRSDGIMGGLEWLNFTDWTDGFMVGSPPGVDLGGSALISLNYAYALDRASELFDHFGDTLQAAEYSNLSQKIKKAVFTLCFDPQRSLLADTPDKDSFSQHTNLFGILTNCIPVSRQSSVMELVMHDPSLVQTTIYYRFYLFQAMFKAGMGDLYLSQLDPWIEMIGKGLTTWEEGDYDERSDCHAWGSSPNYHLLSIVCGINPISPGFREISVTPNLGQLEHVEASMPHPDGTITTVFDHKPGKKLVATVHLPPGTTGVLQWGGHTRTLAPGEQTFTLK
ncbi:MAG: alpha-L-rhamnosidase C-terminal domain-containing protein [Bacteroidales bacterium]